MINVVVEGFIAFLTSACLLHVVLQSVKFWNYQRSNTLERALLKPQRIVIHLHTLHATCIIFSSVNLNAPGVFSVNWCNQGCIILISY
jgi:hypothetical protein